MMKQISAYKQGGVEAAIQVMNEEADLKLIMGWISTKVAKRTLLAVVFVVLVGRFSASFLNLLSIN
jgi:hypothetical protein